jgi:hypothetical protein
MEHRTHWGIVFSDVVVRAVAALEQYKLMSQGWAESEKFEATLTLSVAQTVLGATSELERALKRQKDGNEPDLAELHDFVSLDETTYLCRTGETETLQKNELDGAELLTHLRNALSHPVPCTPDGVLPLTGYASVADEGRIARFVFVDSPWVDLQEGPNNTGKAIIRHLYGQKLVKDEAKASSQRAAVIKHLQTFQRDWDPNRRLRVHEESGRVSIRLGDATTPYVPFIRLSTSVDDLADLCKVLAENYARWLKSLQPTELADGRRRPLRLPGQSA